MKDDQDRDVGRWLEGEDEAEDEDTVEEDGQTSVCSDLEDSSTRTSHLSIEYSSRAMFGFVVLKCQSGHPKLWISY